MRGKTILITGANGEIGHLLLPKIKTENPSKIITLDLHPLHKPLEQFSYHKIEGSVSDKDLIIELFEKNNIDIVIHLAAKLSTSAERDPESAFDANIIGTNNLLTQSAIHSNKVLFFYPSSIAVYGLPDIDTKNSSVVKESDYTEPITLYGIHKLYGENLGKYYDKKNQIDFRSIRFPGLMSADTLPTGGTSDFGPEIIHYFANHKNYDCYARVDSYLPFMAMPDAINSILQLIKVPKNNLKRNVYNISAFSASPKEIIEIAKNNYEQIDINFNIDAMRQTILDSWPKEIDDSYARTDWGWEEEYDFKKAFEEYLIPNLR